MDGIGAWQHYNTHNAWTKHQERVNEYKRSKAIFEDKLALLRVETISYMSKGWDAEPFKNYIEDMWLVLEKQLDRLNDLSEALRKALNPKSKAFQQLLHDAYWLKVSVISLQKLHFRHVPSAVISPLQGDSFQIKRQIVFGWNEYETNVTEYKHSKEAFEDNLVELRFDTIGYIQKIWGVERLNDMKEYWSDLNQQLRKISIASDQIKKELNQESRVFQDLLHDIKPLQISAISLQKSHIRCVLSSVMKQLKENRFHPKHQIKLAKQAGLPLSAFQDEQLNKKYKDAITEKWIQFPIGILDKQGDVNYYCAKQLKAQLAKSSKDAPYRLTDTSEPLALKDFLLVKPNSTYFNALKAHLEALKSHLTKIQQSKRDLMWIIQSTKTQFAYENHQPVRLIQNAIDDGAVSKEELIRSPQLLPFFDVLGDKWIQFPIRRTIQMANQTIYEYYCATTLESLLKKCPDSEPLMLLTNPNAFFQTISRSEPYLTDLHRCLLGHQHLHEPSLKQTISTNSFFSASVSEGSRNSDIKGSSSASSEQDPQEQRFLDIEMRLS